MDLRHLEELLDSFSAMCAVWPMVCRFKVKQM